MLTYPDSVQFLYALGNEIKTAKLGLERIQILLAALGDPQRSFRVVHVAGTNGKGSTCAMIESGLAKWKLPEVVIARHAALPVTSTGKVRRRDLAEHDGDLLWCAPRLRPARD